VERVQTGLAVQSTGTVVLDLASAQLLLLLLLQPQLQPRRQVLVRTSGISVVGRIGQERSAVMRRMFVFMGVFGILSVNER